ncbi:MAG: hypothetical protein DRN04_16820 [Thermoprotei archaeon]|nr:MAG: hypothetical protein DRN04_16820 [Thermoprotei archaeon]
MLVGYIVMQESAELVKLVVEGLLLLYNWLVYIIRYMLEATIFKENPDIAQKYADAIGILSSITAIYLILLLFETAKKILKVVLILGWGLLILALALGVAGGI